MIPKPMRELSTYTSLCNLVQADGTVKTVEGLMFFKTYYLLPLPVFYRCWPKRMRLTWLKGQRHLEIINMRYEKDGGI